ncbi:LysR family transcriptional regulator [Diaphorobacter aerolatus]|nr:LysR family transcriptional regulator [Diaphorobacter aerolatus]
MTPELLPAISAFAEVARYGSFTKAAAQLGVSPSALSQTVRTLERRIGVRLLDRTTRRVGVTELGQHFLAEVAPALAQLGTAVEALNEKRDAPTGVLRLNVSSIAAHQLLVPHLADFAVHYPDVVLELICDNRMLDLVEGGFDAGIRLGESLARDVVALPLGGQLQMACFAAPRYLQERKPPRKPEDLRDHQCMAMRQTTGALYRWEFMRDRQIFEWAVHGNLIANDNHVLINAVRAGAGIGFGFLIEVQDDFERGTLVPLLKPWWATFPGFFLYYPSRAQMPRKLRAFIDFFQPRLRAAA